MLDGVGINFLVGGKFLAAQTNSFELSSGKTSEEFFLYDIYFLTSTSHFVFFSVLVSPFINCFGFLAANFELITSPELLTNLLRNYKRAK